MKYIKHIILTAFVMVMTANAWGKEIYIHLLNGMWPTNISSTNFNAAGDLILEMELSDSFEQVKSKIQYKTGFNPSGMKLSYGTYEDLADIQTLYECGITQNGTTINLTTIPYRTDSDHNSWAFQMPVGNYALRTTWKSNPQLAWSYQNQEMPNTGVSAYYLFSNPVIAAIGIDSAHLNADFRMALQNNDVPLRFGSTNAEVASFLDEEDLSTLTVNGPGTCVVYMVFDGNIDFTYDSVAFTLTIQNPYTLTLATNDAAMGTVKIDSAGVISFLDSVSVKDAAANEYYVLPGAKVAVKAIPAAGYQLLKWEDNSTDLTRTVTVTSDTTLTATFGLPNPGLTPEGELTTSGTRFLDEHGDIVGTPRLTETGEFIEAGGTPDPSYGYDTEKGLYYITVSQGSSALSGGRTFYYSQGQTYSQAAANEANKVSEDIGWFVWSNGYNQATIYYKDGNGQGDMNVDGNVNFLQGDVRLDTVIDPVNHVFTFTPPY